MSDRRYTLLAPVYDVLLRLSGLNTARRRSIDLLELQPAERVLIVGAGTGLDLEHLDVSVRVYASDVTPAMLQRLRRRAVARRMAVEVQIMDGAALAFCDRSFDAVILHLVLAVVPRQSRRCAKSNGF
jgi:phosphatidylethanolamine/phosphatidyl-N-methylethanolamine N-methyltransferase